VRKSLRAEGLMAHFMRVMMFGLISWLVPYGVSMVFMGADGFVHSDYAFYRTVMLITVMLTTAVLLAAHFRSISQSFFREGVLVGMLWLEMNLSLDLLVVLPYSGMGVVNYLAQVGIDYVAIPLLAFLAGYILWQRERNVSLAKSKAAMRRSEHQSAGHPDVPQRTAQLKPLRDFARAIDALPKSDMVRPQPVAQPLGSGQYLPRLQAGTPHHVPPAIRHMPRPPQMTVQPIISLQAEQAVQTYLSLAPRLAELSPQKPVPPRRFPVRYSNLP
jgi:hypothetical protein